mmetsp:Transcript_55526/g.172312  ORF Transcript_55526/g.172312 Transcript_55526/m.172312 type:complete len:214 (-) Transcript_55526:130-771(-)
MNMLIGVLVEVVSAVAAAEKEELAVQFARSKLHRIFEEVLDLDGNRTISKMEFEKILEHREATRTMHDLDVDVVGLVDFADVIFAKDFDDDNYAKELTFPEFMEVVVSFRGSNTATVKDIENLRKLICQSISRCEKQVQRLETSLGEGGGGLQRVNSRVSTSDAATSRRGSIRTAPLTTSSGDDAGEGLTAPLRLLPSLDRDSIRTLPGLIRN